MIDSRTVIVIVIFSTARYRLQNDQAQAYYRHAARLVPYNGQSALHCSLEYVSVFFNISFIKPALLKLHCPVLNVLS